MSNTIRRILFIKLLMVIICIGTCAQGFRWPREKAMEVGAGGSGNGFYMEGAYVRYFQPRKIKDIPFKERFKSLTAQNRYVAFPCKRTPSHKIPPGVSVKISAFYELGSGRSTQYRVIGVDGALRYLVFSNRYLYASIVGGVSVSNNRLLKAIRNDNNKLDYYDRFKYGVLGGFELECMLDKRQAKSLIMGWQEYYLNRGDRWGEQRWYGFVGLRFKI